MFIMSLLLEQTVGQLVAKNPNRAKVFEKYRIDYCCGGKIPLSEACARKNLDLAVVLDDLAVVDVLDPVPVMEWSVAPLADLIGHIVSRHHGYLREELPRISALSARVAKVHGHHAPETIELNEVILSFCSELESHMMKEEQILFPWIEKQEAGQLTGEELSATVASPIRCMEEEHDEAGKALEKFRELTHGFQPPSDACNTWRVLYASLETLEEDMHVHVHKENSILFPRALQLESESKKSSVQRVHL